MTAPTSAITPAQRVRAHRRREALGLILVQVEIPDRLSSALASAVDGLMRPYIQDALAGDLGSAIQAAWNKETQI